MNDLVSIFRMSDHAKPVIVLASLCIFLTGCMQSLPSVSEMTSSTPAPEPATAAQSSTPESEQAAAERASSQAAATPELPAQVGPSANRLYEWHGDQRNVTKIVIDAQRQKATFYDGNEQIGWSTVATGTDNYPTPSGQFEIIEKVSDKRSNLYGRIYDAKGRLVKRNARQGRDPIPPGGRFVGAKMPHFLRITYDGIGLHEGAIPRPGTPASHGCIRLPAAMAATLYQHVAPKTEVTIIGDGPNYGNYKERVRAQRERDQSIVQQQKPSPPVRRQRQTSDGQSAAPRASQQQNDPPQQQAVVQQADVATPTTTVAPVTDDRVATDDATPERNQTIASTEPEPPVLDRPVEESNTVPSRKTTTASQSSMMAQTVYSAPAPAPAPSATVPLFPITVPLFPNDSTKNTLTRQELDTMTSPR
jgi:lipoprotein-anchoring transpeptidase ErfK/SrfK